MLLSSRRRRRLIGQSEISSHYFVLIPKFSRSRKEARGSIGDDTEATNRGDAYGPSVVCMCLDRFRRCSRSIEVAISFVIGSGENDGSLWSSARPSSLKTI